MFHAPTGRGVSRAPCSLPGGATSSRPLEGRFLAALSDQSPMIVGAPLVGALRGRIVPRLCRRSTSPFPAPGRTPIPVGAEDDTAPDTAPDAAPDADPGRRLESRRSTPPGSVGPKQWPADGGAVRGRATTRVAPTSRSTAATRWAPLMDNPRPVSRRIMPEARRGDFQSPTGRAVSSRPVGPIPDDRRDSTNTKGNFVFDRVCRYNLRGRPVVS